MMHRLRGVARPHQNSRGRQVWHGMVVDQWGDVTACPHSHEVEARAVHCAARAARREQSRRKAARGVAA